MLICSLVFALLTRCSLKITLYLTKNLTDSYTKHLNKNPRSFLLFLKKIMENPSKTKDTENCLLCFCQETSIKEFNSRNWNH